MRHPLDQIPPARRQPVFLALLAVNLAIFWVFRVTGASLTTPAAPSGIVAFELAGSPARAEEILASWDALTRQAAAFGLGLDYVFMATYSTAIGIACLWADGRLRAARWPLSGLGGWLAWGQFLAAGLDAVENAALYTLLMGPVRSPWPEVAAVCASGKFALIFFGLVYAFYGLAVHLVVRPGRSG
jgi:hypothetical protein